MHRDAGGIGDRHHEQRDGDDLAPVEALREEGHHQRGSGDAPHFDGGRITGTLLIEPEVLHQALDEAWLHDEHLGTDDPDQDRRDQSLASRIHSATLSTWTVVYSFSPSTLNSTPMPEHFTPPKGAMGCKCAVLIHPGRTALEAARELRGLARIVTPDRAAEAHFERVGAGDRFLHALVLHDGNHRAELLLACTTRMSSVASAITVSG